MTVPPGTHQLRVDARVGPVARTSVPHTAAAHRGPGRSGARRPRHRPRRRDPRRPTRPTRGGSAAARPGHRPRGRGARPTAPSCSRPGATSTAARCGWRRRSTTCTTPGVWASVGLARPAPGGGRRRPPPDAGPARRGWARRDPPRSASRADDELGAYGQERLRASYAVDERPTDPDLWYFESFAGRSATDTPLAVFEELRRRRPELRAGLGDPRPRPLDPAGVAAGRDRVSRVVRRARHGPGAGHQHRARGVVPPALRPARRPVLPRLPVQGDGRVPVARPASCRRGGSR